MSETIGGDVTASEFLDDLREVASELAVQGHIRTGYSRMARIVMQAVDRIEQLKRDADHLDWLQKNADEISVGRSKSPEHEPPVALREWIDDYRKREAESHAPRVRVVAGNLNIEDDE